MTLEQILNEMKKHHIDAITIRQNSRRGRVVVLVRQQDCYVRRVYMTNTNADGTDPGLAQELQDAFNKFQE